jgi:diamine N-acetyltransferase
VLTLRKIAPDNFEECISLTVSEQQKAYIASNAYSLSEAYALTEHPLYVPMPYAIYHEETMIGFAFLIYQPIDENDPDDDESVYYLARMMIDKRYQGRGYGKAALAKIIEAVKRFPHGEANAIVLSCNPKNEPAYSLYKSFGFVEMGIEDEDGDSLLRLEI